MSSLSGNLLPSLILLKIAWPSTLTSKMPPPPSISLTMTPSESLIAAAKLTACGLKFQTPQ